jgi:hypothetical protein
MRKHLERLGMALTILLALGSFAVTQAEDRYHGGALEARQHGYEHGYRDGFHNGREDHERRARFDFNSDDYKHGDRGYEHYMGDKGEYKRGYREGYQGGYDDGYYARRGRLAEIYGRHDRGAYAREDRYDDVYESRQWGYADVAYDIGYRDGLDDGRKDLDHHKEFDPDNHGSYRDADHGYRDSYGDKGAYRREYRTGFSRGYQDGYGRWRR